MKDGTRRNYGQTESKVEWMRTNQRKQIDQQLRKPKKPKKYQT